MTHEPIRIFFGFLFRVIFCASVIIIDTKVLRGISFKGQ